MTTAMPTMLRRLLTASALALGAAGVSLAVSVTPMLTATAQAAVPKIRGVAVVDMQKVLNDTKQGVMTRVATTIRPGGHFCIGHSETLNGLEHGLEQRAPSIYRRPG